MSYEFTVPQALNTGDVVAIYGSPYIKELNLSTMVSRDAEDGLLKNRLEVLVVGDAYVSHLGTRLEKLIIGSTSAINVKLNTISGLNRCKYLKELNIEGFKEIKFLDLNGLSYLETIKAKNSGLTSMSIEKGAPISRLELPMALTNLGY